MSIQRLGSAPRLQKATVRRLGENQGPTPTRTGTEAPRRSSSPPFIRDTFERKPKDGSAPVEQPRIPKFLQPHKEALESIADKLAKDSTLDTNGKIAKAALDMLKEAGLPTNGRAVGYVMRLAKTRRNDDVYISGGE
jgi:hypothetical protein